MSDVTSPNLDELSKAFNGDPDLMIFYATWLAKNRDARAAYLELHPDVTPGSAAVLGSRLLKKVNREHILEAYGLNDNAYYKQLTEGLNANKWNDFTGDREPDHKTRKPYHDKLGKLLGIETDAPSTLIQMNTKELSLDFFSDESKTS